MYHDKYWKLWASLLYSPTPSWTREESVNTQSSLCSVPSAEESTKLLPRCHECTVWHHGNADKLFLTLSTSAQGVAGDENFPIHEHVICIYHSSWQACINANRGLFLPRLFPLLLKRMDEILTSVEADSRSDSVWVWYHSKMKVFKHTVMASEEGEEEFPALLNRWASPIPAHRVSFTQSGGW